VAKYPATTFRPTARPNSTCIRSARSMVPPARAAERRKVATTVIPEKTVAVERHLPVESYVDSEGRLHLQTIVPSEGIPQ